MFALLNWYFLNLWFTLPTCPPNVTCPSAASPSPISHFAGIRIRPLSVWWRWFVRLQTHKAAHHACQSQGPALLFGEREIYQSLPFPLQGLSQIDLMSKTTKRRREEREDGVEEMKCLERQQLPSQGEYKRLL